MTEIQDPHGQVKVVCAIPGPRPEDYTELTTPFLKRLGKLLRRQLRHEKALRQLGDAPESGSIIVHSATVEAQLWRQTFSPDVPTHFGPSAIRDR